MDDSPALVARLLEDIGVPHERQGEREWVVQVPLTTRGPLALVARVGERTLALRGFVMRGPDRNHEEVYRRLLRKQLSIVTWRFALDDAGDVHVAGDVPIAVLADGGLDGVLGLIASAVDEVYEGIVRTGFDVPEDAVFAPPPTGGS